MNSTVHVGKLAIYNLRCSGLKQISIIYAIKTMLFKYLVGTKQPKVPDQKELWLSVFTEGQWSIKIMP